MGDDEDALGGCAHGQATSNSTSTSKSTPTSTPTPALPPISVSISGPAPEATSQWSLDPRQFPYLCTHGRNLSALAALGQLDPALGREAEVEEVLDILGKRRANNPVLVGEPGVGKTAIVEGLAQRLFELRADRIVVELDVAGLVAGTQLRGSFSERLTSGCAARCSTSSGSALCTAVRTARGRS